MQLTNAGNVFSVNRQKRSVFGREMLKADDGFSSAYLLSSNDIYSLLMDQGMDVFHTTFFFLV